MDITKSHKETAISWAIESFPQYKIMCDGIAYNCEKSKVLYIQFVEDKYNIYAAVYDQNNKLHDMSHNPRCLIFWNKGLITNSGYAPGRCPEKWE